MDRYKMEEDWRKAKPGLCQGISIAFDNGLYTDLTFTVGPEKREFKAHKLVVMVRSDVFAVMLEERWDSGDEDQRNVIDIPHASPEAFEYFLKCLYKDKVVHFAESAFESTDPMGITMCLEVLSLADTYHVPGLMSRCSTILKSLVSLDNCVQIFQGTRNYEDEGIKSDFRVVFDFMIRNIKKILKHPTFLELDDNGLAQLLRADGLDVEEILLFKSILDWSTANTNSENETSDEELVSETGIVLKTKRSRKDILPYLIPLIRFPLMGSIQFAKEVVPVNVLDDQEKLSVLMYFANGSLNGLKFNPQPRIQEARKMIPLSKNFKLVKCYDLDYNCGYQDLVRELGVNCAYSHFNINDDLRITLMPNHGSSVVKIAGLRFYGFQNPQQSPEIIFPSTTGSFEYDITFKIYDRDNKYAEDTLLFEKKTSVKVSSGEEIDVLLNTPFTVLDRVDFYINTCIKIKGLFGTIDGRFCFGKNDSYNWKRQLESTRKMIYFDVEDRFSPRSSALVGLDQRVPSSSRSYVNPATGYQQSRLIHSIIYTVHDYKPHGH